MADEIGVKESAQKSLDKLPRSLQQRVIAKIALLGDAPRPSGCIKRSGSSELWRVRVGDYRVVYRINDHAMTIEITIVAHRRESYRGL